MELSKKTTLPRLADEYECTACLACENICPEQAIGHFVGEDGHVCIRVDSSKCTGCLKCQNICEKSRTYFGTNDISSSKIYAAWTENESDRVRATSGGVFAALARTILDSGGCVIGAGLNEFDCRHTAIFKTEDIYRLQGSKYMASSMEDVYRIITRELPDRDVLFVGLGCQCAGVLAYFEGFPTEHKLYSVDLVCGGIPSRLLIDKFREHYPEAKGLSSFRTKDKYELKVLTDEGEVVLTEKSLPLHGFNCGLTNRYSCYNCQFAKAHRKTDITLGDLWDYSQFPDEHKRGISMMIVHSINGERIADAKGIHKEIIDWRRALMHNFRIVCGKSTIFSPRKKMVSNFSTFDDDTLFRLYTMDIGIKQPRLFVFRVYRYIRQRWQRFQNKCYIMSVTRKGNSM